MKKICFTILILILNINYINALDLTIINEQNDNKDNTYTYEINISEISGSYKYSLNNKTSDITFDATGNSSITLKPNTIITIYDLPNSQYKITQNINNNYITYVNNNKNHSITSNLNQINKVTFSNKNKNVTSPQTNRTSIILFNTLIILLISILIISKIKVKKYI